MYAVEDARWTGVCRASVTDYGGNHLSDETLNKRKMSADGQGLPEDVAALYSWANLHGAKYRDFSASRHEARSQAHFRTQPEPRVKPAETSVPNSAPVAEPVAPATVKESLSKEIPVAKHTATRGAWEEVTVFSPEEERMPVEVPPQIAAARLEFLRTGQLPLAPAEPKTPKVKSTPPNAEREAPAAYQFPVHAQLVPQSVTEPPTFWASAVQQPEEEITARWSVLSDMPSRSNAAPFELTARSRPVQPPVLAVFSLAGGVGKTGIVATLGRSLAALGENVLLVDTNSYGLLPFYYGAQDVRPGALRTFSGEETEAAVQMLTLDGSRCVEADRVSAEGRGWLPDAITRNSQQISRIVIDIATASAPIARQVLRLLPRVMVPLVPDLSSLASLQAVEAFFARQSEGVFVEPVYVLNGFDASLSLHEEMRDLLYQKLGSRLLPFELRRSAAIPEALSEGMTVVDYSPDDLVVEDYSCLTSWIRSVSTPAGGAFRRKRWSEV
jgi:cellulose synthase operon protein YhjQ